MKRPILFILTGFISGILLHINLNDLKIYIVIAFIFILTILLQSSKHSCKACFIIISISMIIGVIYTFFVYNTIFNHEIYDLDNKNVHCKAIVTNIKDMKEKVLLYADTITIDKQTIKTKISLDVPEYLNILPGDLIEFEATLVLPSGSRNPGGYNRLIYLAGRKVSTQFYNTKPISIIHAYKKHPILNFGIKLRRMLITRIENLFPAEKAALLSGMLIGYTANLSDEIMEMFSLSGLTHIMAVSGANVVFIIMPVGFLLKKSGLNIFISNVLFLPILFIYILVTGFDASILRASIMASINFIGITLLKKPDTLNTICISCLLLLFYNPFFIADVGFILSYGATLGIVLLYPVLYEIKFFKTIKGSITDVILATLSATLGILPISIKYFYILTPFSLIANLIIVPVTGLITIAGMVSIIVPTVLGKLLSYPITALLGFIIKVTEVIAELPGAKIIMNIPSTYQITLYYFLFLFILMKKNLNIKNKKNYILYMAVILFILNFFSYNKHEVVITFVDVGQGDCIFIKTANNKKFIIDGGGSYTYDVGNNILIPFLLSQHSKNIDGLFSTHNDIDHIGGLISVAENLNIKEAFLPYYYENSSSETVFKIIDNSNSVIWLKAIQKIIIDKHTNFIVLWPHENYISNDSSNYLSLVLMFEYKDIKVLLTGDLDGKGIADLLGMNTCIECDILKIPHHGGNNFGMHDLIKHSEPYISVISVGKNHYGHPTEKVLDLLSENRQEIYRTDLSGAIIIKTNGKKIKIKTYIN